MLFNWLKKEAKKVENHEGAPAFALSPAWELYTAVVTASLSDNFYEKGGQRLERIRQLIGQNKPDFVLQLAIYAREQMNLRSVPLVLLTEAAPLLSGDFYLSRAVNKVVLRADEITELLAYYQLANQRKGVKKLNKLSKQIQKGLAKAFNRFDEYQFAKYDRQGAEVKLRDALFLVHPKAKDEAQQEIFNKIAAQNLATPYTWETELSALGQQTFASDQERRLAVRAKWEELILSKKLGYMAMLRNLRNMIEANISEEAIGRVANTLADPAAVAAAKQLPFRYLAAFRELSTLEKQNPAAVRRLIEGLEAAVRHAAANIQGFDTNTRVLVAADVSGSMQTSISQKSSVMLYDIGLMLAMLLRNRCQNIETGIFGDTWKIVPMESKRILHNVQAFYKREGEVGYSTNGHLVIKDLRERNVVMDKIMIFTDCQLWNSAQDGSSLQTEWKQYKRIAPKAKLYLFDLGGHGSVPVDYLRDDVCLLAGWSDKVFDILAAIEQGQNALDKIKQISLEDEN